MDAVAMNFRLRFASALGLVLALARPAAAAEAPANTPARPLAAAPFTVTPVATLNEPWAMTFLPDGRLLVTEKAGRLRIVGPRGRNKAVTGVPEVAYGGQGGLGDVRLHPGFAHNGLVYLSYAEPGPSDTRGAAVARATLALEGAGGGRLSGVEVIWRQQPKVDGLGHFGHRLAFGPDGALYISSGERQKFDPAQDRMVNLGKIVRLNDDGTPRAGNPFAVEGGVTAELWTLGHRNPLGLAFDAAGRLWEVEMGPKGGDELNLIEPGRNYGWPVVSNGDHYDGRPIPRHSEHPEFAAPKAWWSPVISPAGLIVYAGDRFPGWRGNALIPGLSSQSLVRVQLDGDGTRELERWEFPRRLRAIAEGPDGDVWLLEDGPRGRLLRLAPR
jgi:glucose/arabinose dehydrogenase